MVFTLPNWYITLKSEDFGVANWVKSLAASQEIPAASGSPAILTAEDALGQKCNLLYMTYDASTVHHGKPVANCFTHQICPCVYTRRDDNRLEYLQTLELKRREPIDSWWRPVTWSQDVSGCLSMSYVSGICAICAKTGDKRPCSTAGHIFEWLFPGRWHIGNAWRALHTSGPMSSFLWPASCLISWCSSSKHYMFA